MFGRLSSCGKGAPSFDPAGWLQARIKREVASVSKLLQPEPALAATTWGRDSYHASTGLALVSFPLGGTRPDCQPGRPFKQGPPDLRREVTWPLLVCREREGEAPKLQAAPLPGKEGKCQSAVGGTRCRHASLFCQICIVDRKRNQVRALS